MPPCTSTTGNWRRCACSGVSAPLVEATSAFIGRPSGVVPNVVQRTAFGYCRAKASQSATTSSYRPVSTNPERSDAVVRAGWACASGTRASNSVVQSGRSMVIS